MKKRDYYPLLAMGFVTVLLTANILSEKPLLIGTVVIPAGLLLFPLTYLLGAALTEVYGFARSRQVIWMGMLCNIFMALMCQFTLSLPALSSWELNEAYSQVLQRSSRLMFISVFAYCVGELLNAYLIVWLKQHRRFWIRAICGSWVGEAAETALFVPLAFYTILEPIALLKLAVLYYVFKCSYALCAIPLLNQLVRFLKKAQIEDTPFDNISIVKGNN